MPRWPSSLERRRQARLNIIKHRQNLLKHLEEINDTVLKPRIKLEPKDLKLYEIIKNELNEANSKKHESEIKEENEEKEDQNRNRDDDDDDDDDDEDDEYGEFKSESSDDDISIGSHEFWNGYQTSEDSLADSRRRSNRLKADKNDSQKKIIRNKQNDYEYDLDSVLNSITDDLDHSKSYTSRSQTDSPNHPKELKRFREHEQRINHNAKERACRERIAMMFLDLRKFCSYLNTNKRNPSKHSILLAAKKECDLLRAFEKKLNNEKLKLVEKKNQLEDRLQTLTRRSKRV